MTRKSRSQDKLVNIDKIEKLIELMKKYKLDVVQAETEGEKISLARNVGSLGFMQQSQSVQSSETKSKVVSDIPPVATPAPESTETKSETDKLPEGKVVTSPFVGTFYRSPSPESPSFVEMNSTVKKGQSLCIVEAMKLMNEIESEFDGKIVSILVENGKVVEFGTPLFVIAPV